MGVRGLTTYINSNEDAFLQAFLLHDSKLIIDGHSLCAQLYRKLNCFSAFGGDYDKFASYVKNFFKNLRKCNITAYVLFDGSYEHRKLRTAYNRLRSKIYGASRLDFITQGSLKIFPLLFRDVFIEALNDMAVPFTVCEFEADDEIAAMARQLNCPVLSYDSDFFIYNVQYTPFNTLDLKPKPIEENDVKFLAFQCKIYRFENLINKFGGLKEELLPLLATLLGNDYVEKKVFNKFFSQLKLPKSKRKKNEQQRCIHGLFKWLQEESLDTAIAKILGRLKKTQKDKVFAIMKKSIEGYNNKNCKSLSYFHICPEETTQEICIKYPEHEIVEETEITHNSDHDSDDHNDNNDDAGDTSNDEVSDDEIIDDTNVLPSWFSEGIRSNKIPKSYINLYTQHICFCNPQAENYLADDSFLHTLSLLRYAFDLMTDYDEDYCTYVSREKDCNYKRVSVDRNYSIPRLYEITFSELTEEQLKSCFYHYLEQKMELLDIELIRLLPSNFQLIMISILFWVAHCDVPIGHVHSLILCYIMLDAIDERTGTFRGHHFFNNKYPTKIEEFKKNPRQEIENNESFLNKNKVQYEDCVIAASLLLKLFELDDKLQKKPKTYDIKKVHSFAQFQCTLMQFNCLNILCACPFQCTKYSRSFNGTFVYNLAVKLENQSNPIVFVEQYLKGANSILLFYTSLVKIYDQCAHKMNIINVKSSGKKRRRKKNVDDDEIGFLVKGFESEVVI